MKIGSNIRSLRRQRNITQELLALKIGVTPSAVGNYERDVSFPKEDVLERLFGALECTPNELFGFESLLSDEEFSHLNKYRALDAHGRELVNACTDIEFGRIAQIAEESDSSEMITIAARKGRGEGVIRLKKRKGINPDDLPDYRGGRK